MSDGQETTNSQEPEAPPSLITESTPPPSGIETPPTEKAAEEAPPPVLEDTPLSATDITIPEDLVIDETLRDEFIGLLNDKEKSPAERAQALVDLQVKAATAASEASSKAWTDMQTEWRDAVKADSDVGGDKLEPALGRVGKLISEYGSEELSSVLDLTGAGNNVHVIKFLDKMAQRLTEGGAFPGLPGGQQATAASRLFPSMKG